MHLPVRIEERDETHLTENKCVEYEGIFHFFSMRMVVMFQLQKVRTIEVESEKNCNLIQSLEDEVVIRTISDIQIQI
jgi:hypothetical protein